MQAFFFEACPITRVLLFQLSPQVFREASRSCPRSIDNSDRPSSPLYLHIPEGWGLASISCCREPQSRSLTLMQHPLPRATPVSFNIFILYQAFASSLLTSLSRDKMVANFKTEQSQRRLLTAVIAAHPELKLNFKDIAAYFEDSTPDGIQWQFRQIKRDAEAMRQGKGGATAASVPVTPKTNRKRPATSAPSTGKSTASKKARGSTAKVVQAQVIELDDDDDDENEFPPIAGTPIQGPRFTDSYAKQFYGTDAQTPALDLTQADSPKEDEDFKPVTPSDAAAYSFSQAPQLSSGGGGYANDSYGISQPSFAASSGNSKVWTADEFDDEV
ncbi:hypothetical protein N8I77_009018 [Diaporthe amygdali]|uniref:Uncharacterized protein n=1 Tax=Phomopsis amygdali TaxID=1214568 RepID=A0AAD9SA76_PHOAM|nr:hypothetical protein N8I77_009018 [Diaporthe amygdali]